jgi:hypothetical protein
MDQDESGEESYGEQIEELDIVTKKKKRPKTEPMDDLYGSEENSLDDSVSESEKEDDKGENKPSADQVKGYIEEMYGDEG